MHPSGGSAHKLCMCVHVCNLCAGHHEKCSWPGKWPQDPCSPPLLWPGSPGTPPVPERQVNLTTQPGRSVSRFMEASLGVVSALGLLCACVLACASSRAQAGKGQAPSLTCVCALWPHWPRAPSPALRPWGRWPGPLSVCVCVCWGTLGFSPCPTGSASPSPSCRMFGEAPFCRLSSRPCWKESVSIRSMDAPVLNEKEKGASMSPEV